MRRLSEEFLLKPKKENWFFGEKKNGLELLADPLKKRKLPFIEDNQVKWFEEPRLIEDESRGSDRVKRCS